MLRSKSYSDIDRLNRYLIVLDDGYPSLEGPFDEASRQVRSLQVQMEYSNAKCLFLDIEDGCMPEVYMSVQIEDMEDENDEEIVNCLNQQL